MPIKGLSASPNFLPLIARIKKGAPKQANRPGKNLTYFRFDYEDETVRSIIEDLYGEEPTVIPGIKILGGQSVEQVFDPFFGKFNQSKQLQAKSDGYTIIWKRDKEGRGHDCYESIQFPPDINPDDLSQRNAHLKNLGFTPQGYLSFMLEDFYNATGMLARFSMVIKSWHELPRIQATLAAAQAVTGIPAATFVLTRELAQVNKVINGYSKKEEESVVVLKTMHSTTAPQLAAPSEKPLLQAPATPQLPSGEEPELFYPIKLKVKAAGDTRWGELIFDPEEALFDYPVVLTQLPDDFSGIPVGEVVDYTLPVTLEKHATKDSLIATLYSE